MFADESLALSNLNAPSQPHPSESMAPEFSPHTLLLPPYCFVGMQMMAIAELADGLPQYGDGEYTMW